MATVGKRRSVDQALTEHDVADRLDKAAARVLTIMIQVREMGLMDDVKHSRYLTNSLNALVAEMETWGIEPVPLRESRHERSSSSTCARHPIDKSICARGGS